MIYIDQYILEEEDYMSVTLPNLQQQLSIVKQKAIQTHECN